MHVHKSHGFLFGEFVKAFIRLIITHLLGFNLGEIKAALWPLENLATCSTIHDTPWIISLNNLHLCCMKVKRQFFKIVGVAIVLRLLFLTIY